MRLSDGEVFTKVDHAFTTDDGQRHSVARLARRVTGGSATLYELILPPTERSLQRAYDAGKVYYLQLKGEKAVELVRQRVSEETSVGYVDSYIGTLQFLLRDCPSTLRQLARNKLTYSSAALRKLVSDYNTCVGDEPSQLAPRPKAKVFTAISVRAAYLRAKEEENLPIFGGFTAGAMIAFNAPRISRQLSWRIGAEYGQYRVDYITDKYPACLDGRASADLCEALAPEYIFDYDKSLWTLPLLLRMNLRRRPAFVRPFIEAGLLLVKPSDNRPLPNGRLGAGVELGRWEVFASGELGEVTTKDFLRWRTQLGAGWRIWSNGPLAKAEK